MKMRCLLFYAPFPKPSLDTETLMIAFKRKGHRVLFLNQHPNPELASRLSNYGVECYSFHSENSNAWIRHIHNILYLVIFCWRKKVQIVFSHLEPANFVAVFAQYLIRATTYVCRHHSDLYQLTGRDNDLSYRLVYKLARHVIVVSNAAKAHMVSVEKVVPSKIKVINLAYDFGLYNLPSAERVITIRQELNSDIALLTVGALNEFKRPLDSILILHKLKQRGLKAKLVFLGEGILLAELKETARELGLENEIIFKGFVVNVLEYMKAATFLLHPSISESSCVAVKEAGIVHLPVIVNQGVGDFDDYVCNGQNGFVVKRDNFVEESVAVIMEFVSKKEQLRNIGSALDSDVRRLFDIKNIINEYAFVED